MKTTFIYTDYNPYGYNRNKFNLGVAILSACLKEAGHSTHLIHITEKVDKPRLIAKVRESNPDLIAFSFITNMWPQVKIFTEWLSELSIPMIHGGIHPTIMPEQVIGAQGVTMICRGEGERALVEVCRCMENGVDLGSIPNLWVKRKNGEILKNDIGPLIENLDDLPFLDYELFNYARLEDARTMKRLVVMASRGCPYQCTYCCNHLLRSLYPNRAHYIRFKSVGRLIEEIRSGLQKFPDITSVKFLDDTLSLKKEWFNEFVDAYSSHIGLPYTCNDRVNHITETVADGFKKSGCRQVELGIESGNERIRNTVMKRGLSEEQIISGYALLRERGIRTTAFNILGVPGETRKTLMETVRLNALARPDEFTNAYFYPFAGTVLYDACRERNDRINTQVTSFFERPAIRLDTVSEKDLLFVFKYFFQLVRHYRHFYRRHPPGREPWLGSLVQKKYFPRRLFIAVYDLFDFGKRAITGTSKRIPYAYPALRRVWYAFKKNG